VPCWRKSGLVEVNTLLVLGSKPDPALPPAASYDAVACANGSGYSAVRYGLQDPVYTVVTSLIASGIESGKQSLKALEGLNTGTLYFLRRRERRSTRLGRLIHNLQNYRKKRFYRIQPFYLKRILRSLHYEYKQFVALRPVQYDSLVEELCERDPEILAQLAKKRPSTGLITLVLGIDQQAYQRFILSGFSFELTHPYARNPEISERGTEVSEHATTDIMVIRYLSRRLGNIFTTESTVHERAGVPLLPEIT